MRVMLCLTLDCDIDDIGDMLIMVLIMEEIMITIAVEL